VSPARPRRGFESRRRSAADFKIACTPREPQQGDIRILWQRWSAFGGTSLHADLQRAGVTQVVLSGVATSVGVESTARAAHELGYNVVLATDAMTDLTPEAHRNSVQHIFPRLGETATTAEILDKLQTAR
jgi:nicotinamidase-related amidase